MKKIICLFILMFCYISNAQFKTVYNQFGEPKTEIIDATQMKQGTWNYFDSKDTIFKIEIYKDNVLLSRNYNNKRLQSVNTLNYNEKKIQINELDKNIHGEVIIDENKKIITTFIYYNINLVIKNETKVLKKIKNQISKMNNITGKTVLFF